MTNKFMAMKNILIAALAVFTLSQCAEEDIVPAQIEPASVEAAELPAPATGSMTISGVYTVYEDIKDCSTCTFTVPADASVVDGLQLDLKPGAVICLDKAIQYGDVEFVNLEGTEEQPIRIGQVLQKK